ncbi:HTH_48 domain-containing protein [Nephila pilipes]|uniref:HTH_48 domain-containing protein n=1 Tax=Nephila pilipes TaxID=299642 RepID=A0A8X6NIY1_NEPPI|nr:HTH_48 domain-containing protein [Nephila pilipes]
MDKCYSRKFEAMHNSYILDPSKETYASDVFLRIEEGFVKLFLLATKSRTALLRGDGSTSVENEQRCGRLQTARSAANVERVRNLVMADRRLTVQEIAEEVGMSKDSALAILREDLNMNRVAAKFVPKLLSPEQKDLRFDIAQDLLDTAKTEPRFLNTMITGDGSWVYGTTQKQKDSGRNGGIPVLQGRRKRGRFRSKIKDISLVNETQSASNATKIQKNI